MPWSHPPEETTLFEEQVRFQEALSPNGQTLGRRLELLHPYQEDELALKLKSLGYNMNSDTRTITIPHRKLQCRPLWFWVWMFNSPWIIFFLLGIQMKLHGAQIAWYSFYWWFCLMLFLICNSFTSSPGLLLGYSQIVLVVREEEDQQEKMATIHVRHHRRWAYIISGTFLKDTAVSIPLHSPRDDDSNGQSVLQLVVKQPSDQRKTWSCFVIPRHLLDNDSRGGREMSKMDLGFTLSSELLGFGYENIRFQQHST